MATSIAVGDKVYITKKPECGPFVVRKLQTGADGVVTVVARDGAHEPTFAYLAGELTLLRRVTE